MDLTGRNHTLGDRDRPVGWAGQPSDNLGYLADAPVIKTLSERYPSN
jgi:hypothetical protein